MRAPFRHWRHGLAGLLLLAELGVAATLFFPHVDTRYRVQYLERTDCAFWGAGAAYALGEAIVPVHNLPAAQPQGNFSCGWDVGTDGAYSRGSRAHLYFRLGDERRDLELRLVGYGVTGPGVPAQRVEVSANGIRLAPLLLTGASSEIVIPIPGAALSAGEGGLDLAFDFPDAVPPRAVGRGPARYPGALQIERLTLDLAK